MLLTITLELKAISQNISRKVLGSVLNDISPLNIFSTILLLERFHQILLGCFWPLRALMG